MSTQTKYCMADAQMRAAYPTTNYGTMSSATYIGWTPTSKEWIAALRFAMPDPVEGQGAIDTTVTFRLSAAVGPYSGVRFQRLLRHDWVESQVTWNNYKTGVGWSTAGALGDGADVDASVTVTLDTTVQGGNSVSIQPLYEAALAAGDPALDIVMRPVAYAGVDNRKLLSEKEISQAAGSCVVYTIGVLSVAPTVTTSAVTDIAPYTATGNGNVTADGGAAITERGVCIGTSANPTTAGTKFTAAGTTGAFTAALTGLVEGTLYHARAYAINSVGTSYGDDVTFTTTTATIRAYLGGTVGGTDGTLISIDGSSSFAIRIGTLPLETAVPVMLRSTLDYQTPAAVIVTPPNNGFEVSADGITWGASANVGYVADTNVCVWLRQVVRLPHGWSPHRLLNICYGEGYFTDCTKPSKVTGLTATTEHGRSVLTWDASTDNTAVVNYGVYQDGVLIETLNALTYTVDGLTDGVEYDFSLTAFDAVGNESVPSDTVSVTPVDNVAPAQVTGLTASNGDTQSVLTWSAASDNVAVTGYKVRKGGSVIATLGNVLTYTATGLTNGVAVSFTVAALDAAGNEGAQSATVTATPVAGYLSFDDANRADGAAGALWNRVSAAGTLTVLSNQLKCTAAGRWEAVGMAPTADVLVTCRNVSGHTNMRVCARTTAGVDYTSGIVFIYDGTSLRVAVNNTYVGPSIAASLTGVNHVMALRCAGTSIKTYIDGVLKHDLTSAVVTAAGLAILGLANSGIADDFKVEAAS